MKYMFVKFQFAVLVLCTGLCFHDFVMIQNCTYLYSSTPYMTSQRSVTFFIEKSSQP